MGQSRKFRILVLVSVISVCFCCTQAYGQKIALKTNVLAWGTLSPNLGFEIVTGERTTVDVNLIGHVRPYGWDSVMFSAQPEFRFWFGGRPMNGAFVGVSAVVATYNSVIREKVCDGNAFGLGPAVGYVMPLGKRWNLEFSGGLGFLSYVQKKYPAGDDVEHWTNIPEKANSWGYKMLPTDLGVTFTYIIK